SVLSHEAIDRLFGPAGICQPDHLAGGAERVEPPEGKLAAGDGRAAAAPVDSQLRRLAVLAERLPLEQGPDAGPQPRRVAAGILLDGAAYQVGLVVFGDLR